MALFFDIESLSSESTSIVMSAAILQVDFSRKYTYEELLSDTVFVKFNVAEQKALGRTWDQSTVDFWKQQSADVQEKSLFPDPTRDVTAADGLRVLRDICSRYKNEFIWTRGGMDNLVIDSLAKQIGVDVIAPYWAYRDVRTAISLTKTTEKRGYCDIPGFDELTVNKHDPVHDVAFDAILLMEGI